MAWEVLEKKYTVPYFEYLLNIRISNIKPTVFFHVDKLKTAYVKISAPSYWLCTGLTKCCYLAIQQVDASNLHTLSPSFIYAVKEH